jgi:DUF1680 family protein
MRFIIAIWLVTTLAANASVTIVIPAHAPPRIQFGAEQLARALKNAHIDAEVTAKAQSKDSSSQIVLATDTAATDGAALHDEGFQIKTETSGAIHIYGGSPSGVLYGCLELARRIKEAGKLPETVEFRDAPAFVLRGTCIGMQKTYILPGRRVYEYPYTPDLFPFFYDKGFWREYLDFLAENRMNTLYLWNGHPFASLVRVKDYPYAVEVAEETFRQNQEMYRYIAQEADRRGIWLVQMFYNVLLSKPFAERNGLETQLAAPTDLAADYTRKSIAEFVKEYPNVGLMVCLGEALQGLTNQMRWFTETIVPGVTDGMKAAGLANQPPLILRTHATDARVIVPAALRVYTNLYTEAKFNGESLTTWEPRGERQALQQAMSKLGSTHIMNVHILANLEPFRYGAQRFIKKCVVAGRDRLGARGLHLYPLCYWNWPDSPDLTEQPLKQWKRDWIWFEAWARYVWNPDVPDVQDREYWISRLAQMYGNTNAASLVLDAYNDAGECAPRLLRRFGITEGNRQTLSLGMTLDELVKPEKYRPFPELWESQSPPGERLAEYVEREWNRQPHTGETPPQIITEALDYSDRAVREIDAATPLVTQNHDEFRRLKNDVHCIRWLTEVYAQKVGAATHVLRYKLSQDIRDLDQAEFALAGSLEAYRRLADATAGTYRFANSMQTSQRKIPVSGGYRGIGTNYHWTHLLPMYSKELQDFRMAVGQLQGTRGMTESGFIPASLRSTDFKLLSSNAEIYFVGTNVAVFSDKAWTIAGLAPELIGLRGIRFSHQAASAGRCEPIEFQVSEPVQVLIGYFRDKNPAWLQVPDLEAAAQADERGGYDPVLRNAVAIEGLPNVDVHAFRYEAGKHKLELIGKGSFIVLGIVPDSIKITPRDAGVFSAKQRSATKHPVRRVPTRGSPHAKAQPVPLTEVRWTKGFWAERQGVCVSNMIPALWAIMEGTNYSQFYRNFEIAAGLAEGRHRGAPFNDGDFYKWLEAACASLGTHPDPALETQIDKIISVISKAQRTDGYIHTPVLISEKTGGTKKPFEDRLQFETYNMGHLLTAACVHYRVTGRTNFLALARRTADFLCATFEHPTPELARFAVCPSHYMGMIDMYRATGETKYLECAKNLIGARDVVVNGDDDNQDRIPFEQQTNAMGHAVRANYLYAGATDLFIETGDEALWKPLSAIWTNVVQRKMYITGGCGALYDGASPDGAADQKNITRVHQAYGRNYELPNLTAHNETCANIGSVLWNWRMFLATGEGRFMDVVETALYNSVLSGASLEGTKFFYVNPLRSVRPMPVSLRWKHERLPFMSSFCCPPNLARTLAEVGQYAYSKSDDAVWVNLYGSNELDTESSVGRVALVQKTDYPWDGHVRFRFKSCPGKEFALKLRVPGWVSEEMAGPSKRVPGTGMKINGRAVPLPAEEAGYLTIRRVWKSGDTAEMDLPMPPRLMESNPMVEETLNQAAIKRGPIVYCLEEKDGVSSITDLTVPANAHLAARFDASVLGGVEVIEAEGVDREERDWDDSLYRTRKEAPKRSVKLQFIPYYTWANRGPAEMTVWLPLTPN